MFLSEVCGTEESTSLCVGTDLTATLVGDTTWLLLAGSHSLRTKGSSIEVSLIVGNSLCVSSPREKCEEPPCDHMLLPWVAPARPAV